jgi:hypothetical protein
MKRSPMKRGKPLARGAGFKKLAKPERAPVPAYRLTRPCSAAVIDETVIALPKASPTKPGKRTATVAEKAWMDSITALGCIACLIDGHPGTPGAVHHILSGGQRIGHLFTICLCDPGHHQNGQQLGKVSRHPWKARFEAQYGAEMDLLELSQQLVQGRAAA